MRYRRAVIAGATYFFTVNLAERSRRLLVDRIDDLRDVVRNVRRAHPFGIVAWVVLPDHMHAIWELPDGDADYATRWALIKAGFSRRIPNDERIRASRVRKGERAIWQRRLWEHSIRDDPDRERAVDWPFSTFHRYLRRGWVTAEWGTGAAFEGDFGEASRERSQTRKPCALHEPS